MKSRKKGHRPLITLVHPLLVGEAKVLVKVHPRIGKQLVTALNRFVQASTNVGIGRCQNNPNS